MPAPLDEFPIHQVPLSMRYVATGDRNAYDRCIFQAHDRTGEVLLITGLGVYPNLGVIDAYGCVRRGDRQVVVRASDALSEDRMAQSVGPLRVEVVEPLRQLRVVCDGAEHGLSFDLTWRASFPAIDEPQHIQRSGDKLMLEGCRFVQAGSWSGVLQVEGDDYEVTDDRWVGTRDRSWGIRPSGEPEPAARFAAEKPFEGFWWIWAPLRFDDYMLMVIAQERPDGFRILNEAVRVYPEGSGRPPEQLGWPEVDIRYRSGTRIPVGATIHLSQRGKPLEVEIEPRVGMALNIGCGYGPDPDWTHGQWKGRGWVEGVAYDLTDPAMVGKARLLGGRPRRPRHLRGRRGLGDLRARHLRAARPLGLHRLLHGHPLGLGPPPARVRSGARGRRGPVGGIPRAPPGGTAYGSRVR